MPRKTQSEVRFFERHTLGDANTFRALVEYEEYDAQDKHDLYAFLMVSEEDYKDATQ